MLGPNHRIAGVVAWGTLAVPLGANLPELAGGLFIAAATSHGRLSPDADRYPILCKIIPGGHRGVLHWWLLPALLLWFAPRFGGFWWIAAAVGLAWASHIITDGIFGSIPLLPRVTRRGWLKGGLGLRTGGRVEKWVAVPLIIGAGLYGVWLQLL